MFKDFWENKKYLFEICGLFIAIGAIFLSISAPVNEEARMSLFNIQVVWLLIISICILVLSVSFLKFLKEIQNKENSFNLQGLSINIVLIGVIWFLFNLWSYILALYKGPLLSFLQMMRFPFIFFLFAISFFVRKKIFAHCFISKINNFILILSSISISLFVSFSYQLFCYLVDLNYSLESFLLSSLFIFLLDFSELPLLVSKIGEKQKNK